jgi:hypothetical protein
MAVITCHFNWQGFTRPRQNLHRFLRQMAAQNVPVYGVEALLSGQPAQTVGIPGWKQVIVSRHGMMFQKEALLNAAEKLVPSCYSKLAWIDADVWFENSHWFTLTSAMLDVAAVVQPFSHAIWTDREGKTQYSLPGAASRMSSDPTQGHPGFAMAARRSFFREHGLYDMAITGQGDIHFFCAASGSHLRSSDVRGIGRNTDPFYRWKNRVREWVMTNGGIIAATPGTVVHEWHGDRTARNYVNRHDSIAHTFNCSTHLRRHSEGWQEWTTEAPPEMMAAVAGYFSQRKEDG